MAGETSGLSGNRISKIKTTDNVEYEIIPHHLVDASGQYRISTPTCLRDGVLALRSDLKTYSIDTAEGNTITLTGSDGTSLTKTINNVANATSAGSATKATQDGDGNVITTTYAKKSEVPTAYIKSASASGNTLTLKDASGTDITFTPETSSAVTSVNGQTGAVTLSYSDVGAQVAGSYQAAGNYVSYTQATATVAGTSKTVSAVSPNTLYVGNGLIMGGTAAAAGLTTRGICGVTTPSSTGACTKENLYLNYDGTNDYVIGRKVVLGAGSAGSKITDGGGAYTYCAVRGDEMVSYVTNKIKNKADTSAIPTKVSDLTNDSGFTSNVGTITGIKMNGASKGTSGVVDLGTVITDISGKQNTLSTAQLNACNSGITSTKVTTYDSYATTIANKADTSALGTQVTYSYDSTTGTLTISPK